MTIKSDPNPSARIKHLKFSGIYCKPRFIHHLYQIFHTRLFNSPWKLLILEEGKDKYKRITRSDIIDLFFFALEILSIHVKPSNKDNFKNKKTSEGAAVSC